MKVSEAFELGATRDSFLWDQRVSAHSRPRRPWNSTSHHGGGEGGTSRLFYRRFALVHFQLNSRRRFSSCRCQSRPAGRAVWDSDSGTHSVSDIKYLQHRGKAGSCDEEEDCHAPILPSGETSDL